MTEHVLKCFVPDGALWLQHNAPTLWTAIFRQEPVCHTPAISLTVFSRNLSITHPLLALISVFGMIVGCIGARRVRNVSSGSRVPRLLYSYSFLFFALMNFGGVLYHCLAPPLGYTVDAGIAPLQHIITNIARVIDICATSCSCQAFLFARLSQLHKYNSTHFLILSYISFGGTFIFGTCGALYNEIPYTAEILYPGILLLTIVLVPLLQWPASSYTILLRCYICGVAAFTIPALEPYLCALFGEHGTGLVWCFGCCCVLFTQLERLVIHCMELKMKVN